MWELPCARSSMVNALCIVVLFATGLYIGNPFVVPAVSEEAHFFFLMGWARYIHFIAAFLFTANLLMRAYWFLKGEPYARTNPLRRAFWRGLVETLKSYLFLKNRKPHYIGHNPLAELSYLIFIGLGSVIMVLTGFVLYFEPQWDLVAGGLFSRVAALFGGEQPPCPLVASFGRLGVRPVCSDPRVHGVSRGLVEPQRDDFLHIHRLQI